MEKIFESFTDFMKNSLNEKSIKIKGTVDVEFWFKSPNMNEKELIKYAIDLLKNELKDEVQNGNFQPNIKSMKSQSKTVKDEIVVEGSISVDFQFTDEGEVSKNEFTDYIKGVLKSELTKSESLGDWEPNMKTIKFK